MHVLSLVIQTSRVSTEAANMVGVHYVVGITVLCQHISECCHVLLDYGDDKHIRTRLRIECNI